MKAKKKYFTYENLPMAVFGMYQSPGPRMPQMGQAVQGMYNDYYGGYPESDLNPFTRMQPLQPIGDININKVKPGKPLDKKDLQPPKKDKKSSFNPGNAALLGLAAFDAGLPDPYKKHYVTEPQLGYNPYPYGTGSQALMASGGYIMGEDEGNTPSAKSGGWIQKATASIKRRGTKGVCTGSKFGSSSCPPGSRRYNLAKTFKKMAKKRKKEEGGFIQPGWDIYNYGGIIPDNMSNFSPKRYQDGGPTKKPIIAKGPNDPRYRAYQDSLALNRMTQPFMDLSRAKEPVDHGQWESMTHATYGLPGWKRDRNAPIPTMDSLLNDLQRQTGTIPQGQPIPIMARFLPGRPPYQETNTYYPAPTQPVVLPKGKKKGKYGANVNGGAKIREVGPHYPNSDLLEQWLLYASGGNVNGGARIREVGAHYPNADMMEQWLLYRNGGYMSPGYHMMADGSMMSNDMMAAGGTLSAAKAKEMLKDGTAHGKKLTKKQKQYFGMVAAGKADFGDVLAGDPTKPSLVKPQPYDPRHGSIAGTNAFGALAAMDRPQMETAKGIDLVNESIRSGVLPHMMDKNRAKSYRDMLDPKMYNYLYEFNNRSDLKGMSPQQRMDAFYNIRSNDPSIQSMKDNMRRYGYGPSEFQRTAPTPAPPPGTIAGMASGGVMYDDGGEINTMWGGNAELESYNPYDGGTVAFNGASHDDGGIGMTYNDNPIEVEGGEYASKDDEGNLHIYGNMHIPGTRTKFKSVAKAMAEKEKRYDYLKSRGSELVNNSNPADKYEQLSFNSGKAMMSGGTLGQADIAKKKEKLSGLQKAMLDMASEYGLEPQAMSQGKVKKARGGASLPFYQDGGDPNDPTRADRNNNPGNIKYSPFAKKYGAKKDKDGFAIFPDRSTGEKAMKELLTSKSYSDLSAKDAISKWTDGHPYRYDLGPLTDKKISEMDPDELSIVLGTMAKGEGTKYGVRPSRPKPAPNTPAPQVPNPGPFVPYTLPNVPLTGETTPSRKTSTVNPPPVDKITVPPDTDKPSNVEPLHANQLMGEIFAAATNHVEPVAAQRYEPQLYSPYQVSFQDRLNENERAFNAQMRAVGSTNPSAMGALAAQKYAADNQVKAEEFRTNQSIANDIINKNVALTNDAQMKNLQIADQQMVRQSEARSKTRQLNQMIANSISSKYAQNEFENKRLAAYENLYDYRFVPTESGGLKATYYGPNAMFNFDPKAASQRNDLRTVSRYDQYGNLKGYTQYDDYDLIEQSRALDLEMKRRKLPLMTSPKLD